MTDLSPAAQAILDAANDVRIDVDWWPEGMSEIVSAALRTAAYQVVPSDPYRPERWEEKDEIRSEFLAIADELEGQ